MTRKVVVENTLDSYINYFKKSGYDVHKLYVKENIGNVMNSDYDGIIIEDINKVTPELHPNYINAAPIIEAKGKTPKDVYSLLSGK